MGYLLQCLIFYSQSVHEQRPHRQWATFDCLLQSNMKPAEYENDDDDDDDEMEGDGKHDLHAHHAMNYFCHFRSIIWMLCSQAATDNATDLTCT